VVVLQQPGGGRRPLHGLQLPQTRLTACVSGCSDLVTALSLPCHIPQEPRGAWGSAWGRAWAWEGHLRWAQDAGTYGRRRWCEEASCVTIKGVPYLHPEVLACRRGAPPSWPRCTAASLPGDKAMATAEGLALDELVAPMHFSPQLEAAIQEVCAQGCKRPAHGVPAPSAQGCRLQHTGPTTLLCGLGARDRPPNSPHTPAPCVAAGGLLSVWVTGSRVLRETTRSGCPGPGPHARRHLLIYPLVSR
jgi:hypothetical protein